MKARPIAVTLTQRQAIPPLTDRRIGQTFYRKGLTYCTAALKSDPESGFRNVLSVIDSHDDPLSISDLIKHENVIQDVYFHKDKILIIIIGVPADDRFLWRWMLSLKDETLIISKSNKPPWYSSKPPELFYFTLQRPEMTSV